MERVAAALRLGPEELERIVHMIHGAEHYRAQGAPATGPSLADAYEILGVDEDASNDEVKRAYRRLMNRHHPDKLVSKGLPEEMIEVATEKTQEIRVAYEKVKQSRAA